MGCGSSREKEETGIAAVLDSNMEKLNIEKLDSIFENAGQIIEKVEGLRSLIVDDKDELIIGSGACSYLEPKLNDAFYGICWKLSADNKGKFLDAGLDFDIENTCLIVTGTNNSEEATKAFDQFNAFIKGVIGLSSEMMELSETVQQLSKDITENPQGIIEEVKNTDTSNPFELASTVKNAYSNIDNVRKVVVVIPALSVELASTLAFLKEIPVILSDSTKLSKIDEVGKKACQHKYTEANVITWQLMEDPKMRFGTKPQDGIKNWEDKRKNKQETKKKLKKK
jgi:hypothetical protein